MFYDSCENRGPHHAGRHGRHRGGFREGAPPHHQNRHPDGPPGSFGAGGFRGRGGGFPRGRKLSSADLQLVLLALLEEKPAHGYELIRALEERSGGFYSPSPGVIYPALTYLDEIGQAEAEADGKRKLYRITPEGAARLAENREAADALLDAFGRIARRMDRVRAAFEGTEDAEQEMEEHFRAFRTLKRALREKRGSPAEELERIAAILYRAAKDIAGGKGEA